MSPGWTQCIWRRGSPPNIIVLLIFLRFLESTHVCTNAYIPLLPVFSEGKGQTFESCRVRHDFKDLAEAASAVSVKALKRAKEWHDLDRVIHVIHVQKQFA